MNKKALIGTLLVVVVFIAGISLWKASVRVIKPGNTSNQPELPEGIDKEDIRDYLQENIVSPVFGGKVFCAYDLFGSETKNDEVHIYLWTLCTEYYLRDGHLAKGSG
ncbi:MAG: hypothetical protein ACPLZB_06495, partial [Caldisericaceae bacterium]